jgi:hypothetical protein
VSEFNEMMLNAQADAYGDGLDQSTAHPYMWAVKGHYYGSHFYNWPYTYGFLFGLGLFTKYRDDPQRFQQSYDDVLSRAGMKPPRSWPRCSVSTSRRNRSGPRASTSCATTSTSTWTGVAGVTISLYQPGREELAELLDGQPRYRVDQIWQGLYQNLATPAEMTNLPKAFARTLSERLEPACRWSSAGSATAATP